jgi:hypothetical protein
MTQLIQFIDTWGNVPNEYYPEPAVQMLPDWYKKAQSFVGDSIPNMSTAVEGTRTSGTIKRCKPVLDSLSAGYLIKSPVDINVRKLDDGQTWYEWPGRQPLDWHPPRQAPGYPNQESRESNIPKFLSPWGIITPPGYSCLFVSPVHRKLPFHTMEGVVDTDGYHFPVAFPFTFKDDNFTGLIEAGTPIVQVIPFKRQSWSHEIRMATEEDKNVIEKVSFAISSVFNGGYAKRYWARKEYR